MATQLVDAVIECLPANRSESVLVELTDHRLERSMSSLEEVKCRIVIQGETLKKRCGTVGLDRLLLKVGKVLVPGQHILAEN